MKFVIKKGSGYWFRIVSSNGRILASSEQYTSKSGAQNAIDTIKAEARTARIDDET